MLCSEQSICLNWIPTTPWDRCYGYHPHFTNREVKCERINMPKIIWSLSGRARVQIQVWARGHPYLPPGTAHPTTDTKQIRIDFMLFLDYPIWRTFFPPMSVKIRCVWHSYGTGGEDIFFWIRSCHELVIFPGCLLMETSWPYPRPITWIADSGAWASELFTGDGYACG